MIEKRLAGVAPIVMVLLCSVFAFRSVEAQAQTAPQATSTTTTTTTAQSPADSGASADLSITARVTARELRFEKVPNPRVEFTGRPRRDTVRQAERENLPAEVQPGVTYRDIGIRLRITSVFADIDRIVAEALGEVPVNEDAAPPQNTTPQQENASPERGTVPERQRDTPEQSGTSLRRHTSIEGEVSPRQQGARQSPPSSPRSFNAASPQSSGAAKPDRAARNRRSN